MSEANRPAHIPVLLEEVIRELALHQGDTVIDATAGQGGHSIALAQTVGPTGRVLALERDPHELVALGQRITAEELGGIVTAVHGNYMYMVKLAHAEGIKSVQGILFDFGFSSWHITESGRGFTFQHDEPLDMRFDPTEDTPTAQDIVNGSSRQELTRIIAEYGEERQAQRVAKAITIARKRERITTSGQLAAIIEAVLPRHGRLHPATKVFQALRMVVNDELGAIAEGLNQARILAAPQARIATITFHSLEDRLVKTAFRSWEDEGLGRRVHKNVMKPHYQEVIRNRRSRSARLRVFETS
ncbi:MAG: 16S rRNA (cytosine(1402)-N(4))-methyltransferase RsmH [Candidatus Spechtbacterales bacterium]